MVIIEMIRTSDPIKTLIGQNQIGKNNQLKRIISFIMWKLKLLDYL